MRGAGAPRIRRVDLSSLSGGGGGAADPKRTEFSLPANLEYANGMVFDKSDPVSSTLYVSAGQFIFAVNLETSTSRTLHLVAGRRCVDSCVCS